MRHAVIKGLGHDRLEEVRRYLPSNYTADSDGGSIFIHGEDRAGWTLDDYVIPRLASGMIAAVEIPEERGCAMFTAGWNMPGYLPEMEPQDFDTFQEAKQFLVDEVDLFWDQDQEVNPEWADGRWLPVHTALHNHGSSPELFSAITGDGSLVLWVVRKEEES